ncbi:MAG: carboxypeptidase regulatory-like domain-containing protein [bacterium]|nr:carboxypeptidase regulatory-like domain-containing protein [bacterium]
MIIDLEKTGRGKNTQKFNLKILIICILAALAPAGFVLASVTDGTIDASNKYAWSENAGWIDFAPANGGVRVTDSGLSGYAFGENIGWINLGSITNDGNGNLTGYAWSENAGWIDFAPPAAGVIINSAGQFTGRAYGENIGWLNFDSDYKVQTDWRPRSARPECNNALDDDSDGKIDYPADPGCSSLDDNSEVDNPGAVVPFFLSVVSSAPVEKIQEIAAELPEKIEEIKNNTVELIKPLVETPVKEIKKTVDKIAGTFKSEAKKIAEPFKSDAKKIARENKQAEEIKKAVPPQAPEVLKGGWPLIPEGPVNNFALTPLTKDLSLLLNKFPELEKAFVDLGVNKIDDLAKLEGVKLILPGLTEALGLNGSTTANGGIVLSGGIPLNSLPPAAKEKIPTDIVFAKSAGQLIDFKMELTVAKTGETQSKINVTSGRSFSLLVKPESQAKSVKGLIIFKDKAARLDAAETLAGALRDLAIKPALAETETRLVLAEFNYNDDDHDGIWTADVQAPAAIGNYEIITKIDYADDKIKAKEIKLITVVDPEGYIYRKSGENETRLSGAVVSIFWQNPQTNNFELWPAGQYQQANPQTTDITGRYSFLVPPGEYYLKVELDGYAPYQGEKFTVKEGNSVHANIELKTEFLNWNIIDWKIIFMLALAALVAYNFYRDRKRNKN